MINYFDIIILTLTIIVDYLIYRYLRFKKNRIFFLLLVAFLYFYVLPKFSMKIEINENAMKYPDSDGFNNFYLVFKWPVWWLIGIAEIIALLLITKKKQKPKE